MTEGSNGELFSPKDAPALLIYSQRLADQLSGQATRLPPNYVGVRRVRPDVSPAVGKSVCKREVDSDGTTTKFNPAKAVFVTVGEDGVERRMNRQEKKKLKRQLALQHKENKKRIREQEKTQGEEHHGRKKQQSLQPENATGVNEAADEKTNGCESDNTEKNKPLLSSGLANSQQAEQEGITPLAATSATDKYHTLQIDPNVMEQELNELQNDRHRLPPVILPPSMTSLAKRLLSPSLRPGILAVEDGDERKSAEISNDNGLSVSIQYDDALSLAWAKKLKTSLMLAETIRNQEEMRPMAYQLSPEPWTRYRYNANNNKNSEKLTKKSLSRCNVDNGSTGDVGEAGDAGDILQQQEKNRQVRLLPTTLRQEEQANVSTTSNKDNDNTLKERSAVVPPVSEQLIPQSRQWSHVSVRPVSSSLSSSNSTAKLDSDHSIILEYLHRRTPYYVSCGAKFGCDLLLYDGPRHERHAFAGLRILTATTTASSECIGRSKQESESSAGACDIQSQANLSPLPTPYSMSGYVRGLNTAGKLALVATVFRERTHDPSTTGKNVSSSLLQPAHTAGETSPVARVKYHVAIVDLALEKVLTAPTHQRRYKTAPQSKRKDIGRHLAKHKSTPNSN